MIRVFDLTKQQVKNPVEESICSDYDESCEAIDCALTCWMQAPEYGICPILRRKKQ